MTPLLSPTAPPARVSSTRPRATLTPRPVTLKRGSISHASAASAVLFEHPCRSVVQGWGDEAAGAWRLCEPVTACLAAFLPAGARGSGHRWLADSAKSVLGHPRRTGHTVTRRHD